MSDKSRSAAQSAAKPKVVVERTYRAPVEELWDLWTTKEGFESWWGPDGFRAEVHAIEARLGGALRYDMIADSPEMVAAMKQMSRPSSHPTSAKFTEIELQRRLAITSLIDFLPGVTPYENTIAVDFHPSGDSVRMVVTLDPLHSDELTRMSTQGFTSQLGKLDRRFG
ncbi:MAG TPA: SRPBCC domain-containing protein [Polyangiaceae bacterium]